jgi:hypothetical protein
MRLLDAKPLAGAGTQPLPERCIYLTRGLLRLNLGPFRHNCLAQSLILFHLLRRAGHPVRIHFGVAKRKNRLEGHCWLESEGKPIAESADPHLVFRTIYAYPIVF